MRSGSIPSWSFLRAATHGCKGVQSLALAWLNPSAWSFHQLAMSMRRANQTSSRPSAYSRNSLRPDMRAAWPMSRGCRPIDIILGCVSPSSQR